VCIVDRAQDRAVPVPCDHPGTGPLAGDFGSIELIERDSPLTNPRRAARFRQTLPDIAAADRYIRREAVVLGLDLARQSEHHSDDHRGNKSDRRPDPNPLAAVPAQRRHPRQPAVEAQQDEPQSQRRNDTGSDNDRDLMTLVGDGHTTVAPQAVSSWKTVPLQFELFREGLYIVAADPKYADLAGKPDRVAVQSLASGG